MSYKQKVREGFDRKALNYNKYSVWQREAFDILLTNTSNYITTANNILDLGSGTGAHIPSIKSHIKYNSYYGVDISDKMISYSKKKFPEANFINSDIESFHNIPNIKFSLIISNFTLHWLKDLSGAIQYYYSLLETGGVMSFNIPLKSSLKQIEDFKYLQLPEFQELESIAKSGLYNLELLNSLSLTHYFPRGIEAFKAVKYTGGFAKSQGKIKDIRADIISLEKKYREEKGFPLSFDMVFCILSKKA